MTILGFTNSRIYRYELPTNIPGMTFHLAYGEAEPMVPAMHCCGEPGSMVGLTHLGYPPYGGEIDSDELIAQNVAGLDVIIGGHSHT